MHRSRNPLPLETVQKMSRYLSATQVFYNIRCWLNSDAISLVIDVIRGNKLTRPSARQNAHPPENNNASKAQFPKKLQFSQNSDAQNFQTQKLTVIKIQYFIKRDVTKIQNLRIISYSGISTSLSNKPKDINNFLKFNRITGRKPKVQWQNPNQLLNNY